ncbi:MAG: CheY-like chemotaxis protein [Acidimicrobiales bacterium]
MRRSLFEPFVGSKGAGRGLGLSTVLRIVREHGGAIRVDGCPGEGAVFEVLLPVDGTSPESDHAVANELDLRDSLPAPASGPQVLLVVGDPAERSLVEVVLEREGYVVYSTSSLSEGLELIVLSTDLAEGDRLDLLMELRERQPEIGVVLVSDPTSNTEKFTRSGDMNSILIGRPFNATEMIRVVAKLRQAAVSREAVERPQLRRSRTEQ